MDPALFWVSAVSSDRQYSKMSCQITGSAAQTLRHWQIPSKWTPKQFRRTPNDGAWIWMHVERKMARRCAQFDGAQTKKTQKNKKSRERKKDANGRRSELRIDAPSETFKWQANNLSVLKTSRKTFPHQVQWSSGKKPTANSRRKFSELRVRTGE